MGSNWAITLQKQPICCVNDEGPVDYSKQIVQAVFGEYQESLAFYNPVWFITFTTVAKASTVTELCLILLKYCKTFDSP